MRKNIYTVGGKIIITGYSTKAEMIEDKDHFLALNGIRVCSPGGGFHAYVVDDRRRLLFRLFLPVFAKGIPVRAQAMIKTDKKKRSCRRSIWTGPRFIKSIRAKCHRAYGEFLFQWGYEV